MSDATEAQALIGQATAVAMPSTPERTAEAMRWCFKRGLPIVPRGGGTGYAGGCLPQGGVVVAFGGMARVRSFDPLLWRIEIEAGATTRTLQRLARENGLFYPVDPGAAEQSQLGGNVATNAGGPHAFKYGVTGAWVTGLEVVIPPGDLIKLGGQTRKDVAGYDLRSLLIGSEGTLGLITAINFRLIPAVEARYPVVAFYSRVRAGCDGVIAAMASGITPAAIEYLDSNVLAACKGSFPGPIPIGTGLVLIAESDGEQAAAKGGQVALAEAMSTDALDVRTPTSSTEIEALWRWREGIGIAADAWRGGKISEDIVVPVDRLADAIEATVEIGARHGLTAGSWGHAGDGNLHSTFMFDRGNDDELRRANDAAAEIFDMAIALGGSISGEHGIGLVKNGQLRKQWDRMAVDLHSHIKSLFDPASLLNPGKKLA